MVALLLKQQIQKKLSTFCHLCLVQPINSSLTCYSHVKISCFPILQGKKKICFRKWWWSWRPLPPALSFSKALNIHKKTSALESIFNKSLVLHACSFIKKKLEQRYFPVNSAKFLRTVLFIEHIRWQLLLLSLPFKSITEKTL